jgi:hypothetical protein
MDMLKNMGNFEIGEMIRKHGFIDKTKVLDFPVDVYMNELCKLKSPLEKK